MFCTKCGVKSSVEAIYCLKCGAMLEAEEETRIARTENNETRIAQTAKNETQPPDEDEREIFSISPTLMFVKIGYVAAIFGGLLLAALFGFLSQNKLLAIPVLVSVLAGLSLLLIPAFYHLKQKIVRYTLTDSKIEIDQGLISKTTKNVPLRTIQDVTVSATVAQRMLGFGNLIIDNASETGGKIVLKNINSPKKYADVLLKQMRLLNK